MRLDVSLVGKFLGGGFDVREVGEDLAQDLIRAEVAKRFEAAAGKIAKAMKKAEITVALAGAPKAIRDAQFRLWRSVIPNGHVADGFRDAQETKVRAIVEPQISAETKPKELVRLVAAATLDVTF